MENVSTFRVEGIGSRKTGEKNGRKYDFVSVAFTFVDPYCTGRMAYNEGINYDVFVQHDLQVGKEYDCVYGFRNFQPHIIYFL